MTTAQSPSDEEGTLTPRQKALISRKAREREIRERVRSLEIGEEARRRLAEKKAGALEIPEPYRLDLFLKREMPGDEEYLIDGLWPVDGNVVFTAARKFGKTTAVGNLCRSLVDGDPFMDYFEVMDTRKVYLLDFEMTERMLQGWLRHQGIQRKRSITVHPLRGQASTFAITDDKTRALWARMIEDTGAEVLILDPLRPVIDALNIKEANEVGPLLQAFAALKLEAGLREGLVVHHHGHGAQRAVGDSRLETWPDAMWSGTMEDHSDPESIHYFQAMGRDVNVPRGVVLLDEARRQTFRTSVEDEAKAVLFDRLVEWLEKALAQDLEAVERGETPKHQPGERNTSQIEAARIPGFGSNGKSAKELEMAVNAERVVLRDEGKGKSKWYSLPPHRQ
ncbi:hypothetical protein B1729_14530 [Microbacterium sp. B35-04]|uniref:AAA family ATPase n=1 Tax=Microbacterium sp. B35-04 TaxID=1961716 RepID=UPI0013D4017A|nr:AAA family ATPase [Microbacterium sp. B35-04]KAF2412525.1 hypothetical protein B1729_14530 [Microbacterium sp. B35-04]